jgi:hypothetical protein
MRAHPDRDGRRPGRSGDVAVTDSRQRPAGETIHAMGVRTTSLRLFSHNGR